MLTEYVSDPRRANWLTISSMSEDLSWPDEANNSRPSWELEAEILRLTTRLMMRERELQQVKSQLKGQAARHQQQAATWRRRVEEQEKQMQLLLVQKDAEMQSIISQLLLFESELRKEQSRIEELLSEKDVQISLQKKEIELLKQSLDNDRHSAREHAADSLTLSSLVTNGDKDRQDKVGNRLSHNLPFFEDPAVSETQEAVSRLRDDRDAEHRQPKVSNRISQDQPPVFGDLSETQEAVSRLRNGLMKIRAIQDVTNVKSLVDSPKEVVFLEKKKVPSTKTPQKMKDLKAKRVNSHKMHRPVITDFTGQVVL